MSLGTLPLIASEGPPNLVHVILDNEVYESTGGQTSISSRFDVRLSVGKATRSASRSTRLSVGAFRVGTIPWILHPAGTSVNGMFPMF